MPYRGVDYYGMDELLTDDERLIRDTFRRFVDEELMPVAAGHFRAGTFPKWLPRRLGALGALGAHLEGYGCAGLGAVAYGVIMLELERCDSGFRSFASVQGSLAMHPIHAFGTEEQKRRWLPRMAAGEAIGCFGLTEPDFGSNPGGMLTTARKDNKGWILNGRKMWITNGTVSDVAVVWAKVEDTIKGFLVTKGTPGFSAPEQKHKWSLRASVTSELVLQDVRVGESSILPKSGGLKSPLMCLTQARYGIAWGALGAAHACFDEVLKYSKQRIVFERPLAGFQLAQKKLADMATQITLGQLIALRLGRLKDEGRLTPAQVSMGKRNNVHIALEAARVCRDMMGANGVSLEYQTGRHLCNLESVYTYEGTHDIHTLAIGQELTDIAAFK